MASLLRMKAILLSLILLRTYALSSGRTYFIPADSLIDRMINNKASLFEKREIFNELKTLLEVAPNDDYKYFLLKVVTKGFVYPFPEEIGGSVGLQAVENLEFQHRFSSDAKSFLGFLNISIEFMKNRKIGNYLQSQCFNAMLSRMNSEEQMVQIGAALGIGSLKIDVRILEALGMEEGGFLSTPPPPFGVYYQLSYYEHNKAYGNMVLTVLEYAEKHNEAINDTYSIVHDFNGTNTTELFSRMDNLFRKYAEFEKVVKILGWMGNHYLDVFLEFADHMGNVTRKQVEHAHGWHFELLKKLKSPGSNLQLLKFQNQNVKNGFIAKVMSVWAQFDQNLKNKMKLLMNGANKQQCEEVWAGGKKGDAWKMVMMAKTLDTYGADSCFKKFGLYRTFV